MANNLFNTDEPIGIIDHRMLSDQVSTLLVRELIFGRLQPGQRINEAELARQLGISRNPIREAIRRLEERGLLVAVPRKGTFVRTFLHSDIDEIFSFRIVVERFAMEQALPQMTDPDIERIAGFVDAMVAAANANDEIALVENDLAFHLEICRLSKNRQTLHAFTNIQAEVQMLITMAERQFESQMAAAVDHWPIVEALRTRNPQKAMDAIRDHIRDSWRHLLEAYDREKPRSP
ncbi:GntR family transcriptional regulator [Mesorhizobium sp. M7A.F.Ca.US.006.01.1.1]|uniref:GntR family transcriptional regulator n=1 Tax=Mesorhizobium sp. M7A.F.Ca.US.006.01.1.1 TaxID=2496707 RepID=UPI000FCA4867|nr:GntR family transcriptional regulator [Mesorhizobium sp. M7A.F.Ca.US.006.01.1.1]RUZ79712.1 GntR family transcriptional regulator [Mesorhizobium sp. M7A.F.Ca.US.006.01.1.1]